MNPFHVLCSWKYFDGVITKQGTPWHDKTLNTHIYFSRSSLIILSEVVPCFNQICSLYRSRNLGCSSRNVFIYSIIPAVFKDLNSSRVIRPSSISFISRTLILKRDYVRWFERRVIRKTCQLIVTCQSVVTC